jgi:hypothetical protein
VDISQSEQQQYHQPIHRHRRERRLRSWAVAPELDPSLGGNPADLLPYADTGTDFPVDGEGGLFVISRNTTFTYKGPSVDVANR